MRFVFQSPLVLVKKSQKPLLFLSFLLMASVSYAQNVKKIEIGVYGGYVSSLLADTKLNDTEYTGETAQTILINSAYLSNNYLYILEYKGLLQRFSPEQAYLELFEFNYIRSRNYHLEFNAYRQIKLPYHKWWLGLGIDVQSNYSINRLYFNSLIFDGNTHFRKSYTFTIGSLGAGMILQYLPNHHHRIQLKAAYRPLGLVLRPDDNYVKYMSQVEGGSALYWLAGQNFQAGLFHVSYTFVLNDLLGFELILNTCFEKQNGDDHFKMANNQIFFGTKIKL